MSARIWDTHEVGDAGEAEALTVVVDVASLRRSATGSITAGIWFEAGDECFPENGWNDFAVVILGWWLSELRALPARNNPRATARLEFMDGPVEVEIRAPEAMASRDERFGREPREAQPARLRARRLRQAVPARRLASQRRRDAARRLRRVARQVRHAELRAST